MHRHTRETQRYNKQIYDTLQIKHDLSAQISASNKYNFYLITECYERVINAFRLDLHFVE